MKKISGTVIKGQGLGRILGFPTANLDRRHWTRLRKKPKMGIWAGNVFINPKQYPKSKTQPPKKYKAAIVIGPIDKTGLPKIEAHLLGFRGNLYGKYLITYLITYLRPFKKYKSEALLKKQINLDIKKVKNAQF